MLVRIVRVNHSDCSSTCLDINIISQVTHKSCSGLAQLGVVFVKIGTQYTVAHCFAGFFARSEMYTIIRYYYINLHVYSSCNVRGWSVRHQGELCL